jgi:hypothetical protein
MSTTNPGPSPDPGEVRAYCETTTGVQSITGMPPRVGAWSCTRCGTQWVITVMSPRPRGDDPAAMAEHLDAVSLLRRVITLADGAPRFTDEQLRDRLVALMNPSR